MSDRLPPLRQDLEFIPVSHEGRELFLVRDPLGLVSEGYALDARLGPLLARLDGAATARDLQAEWMRQDCSALATGPEIEGLVAGLDQAMLLDSPGFREARARVVADFAARPTRPAFLAGKAYPAQPGALAALLDEILDSAGTGEPSGQPLRALVAPHIDLAAGREAYARAYGALRGQKPRRVVVLGVGHSLGDGLFSLTAKTFPTPLGRTASDGQAVERLRLAGGRAVAPDDFAHRGEHSIEFQLLFLQHLLGPENFTLVPILCGPPALFLPRFSRQDYLDLAGPFLAALKDLCAEPGTLLVAGVDCSHIGPKFGHEVPAQSLEPEAMAHDRALLERCAARDAEGFWAESARVQDRFNVCGFPALAALLEVLPQGRGQVLDYRLWREAPTRSAVGFGAMVFPAGDPGQGQPGEPETTAPETAPQETARPTRRFDTSHFIRKKAEVAEADKVTVMGNTPEELRPDMARTGNVILAGLTGSGRRALGEALAQALGREFLDWENVADEVEAATLLDALAQGGQVVRLPLRLLRREEVRDPLRRTGVVFYLAADVPLLLARRGPGAQREAISREVGEMEPLALSFLHFLLRAEESPDELLLDAREKVGLAER
jgi:AmmeMemoRadiSam system protein B